MNIKSSYTNGGTSISDISKLDYCSRKRGLIWNSSLFVVVPIYLTIPLFYVNLKFVFYPKSESGKYFSNETVDSKRF